MTAGQWWDISKEMILEHVNQFFAILAGPVGLGVIIDQFVKSENRLIISQYILGQPNHTFPEYDRIIISTLIGLFLVNGKIRLWRVLIASYLMSILAVIFIFQVLARGEAIVSVLPILTAIRNADWETTIGGTALTAAMFTAASFPLDFFSIWFSKKLFIDLRPVFPRTIAYIVLDFTVSTGAFLFASSVFIAIGYSTFGEEGYRIFGLFGIAFLTSAMTGGIINIIQIFAALTGTISRTIVLLLKLGNTLASRSEISRYPFTFIGLVTGTILFLASFV